MFFKNGLWTIWLWHWMNRSRVSVSNMKKACPSIINSYFNLSRGLICIASEGHRLKLQNTFTIRKQWRQQEPNHHKVYQAQLESQPHGCRRKEGDPHSQRFDLYNLTENKAEVSLWNAFLNYLWSYEAGSDALIWAWKQQSNTSFS